MDFRFSHDAILTGRGIELVSYFSEPSEGQINQKRSQVRKMKTAIINFLAKLFDKPLRNVQLKG